MEQIKRFESLTDFIDYFRATIGSGEEPTTAVINGIPYDVDPETGIINPTRWGQAVRDRRDDRR